MRLAGINVRIWHCDVNALTSVRVRTEIVKLSLQQVFLLVLLIDLLRADLLTALHAVVVRVLLVLTLHM